ncbi:hypothetical protein V5799_003564 [Amblyomma americanum]|uniref:Uncharacterized protein n=1 Tax=Amblyomma americanum TaxID=6943 RepID=A0AAQ4D8L4_AMBAM
MPVSLIHCCNHSCIPKRDNNGSLPHNHVVAVVCSICPSVANFFRITFTAALLSDCSLTFLLLTCKVVNEFALLGEWDRIAGFAHL